MEDAIARITARGAKVARQVPLITLRESVEGCDFEEWDDVFGKLNLPENF